MDEARLDRLISELTELGVELRGDTWQEVRRRVARFVDQEVREELCRGLPQPMPQERLVWLREVLATYNPRTDCGGIYAAMLNLSGREPGEWIHSVVSQLVNTIGHYEGLFRDLRNDGKI